MAKKKVAKKKAPGKKKSVRTTAPAAAKKKATRKKAQRRSLPSSHGGHTYILTDRLAQDIASRMTSGAHPELVCQLIGVHFGAYQRWMKLGREQYDRIADLVEQGINTKKMKPNIYLDFYNMVNSATANPEYAAISNWANEARTDWKAGQAYLTATNPMRYDPKRGQDTETSITVKVVAPTETPSIEAWAAEAGKSSANEGEPNDSSPQTDTS